MAIFLMPNFVSSALIHFRNKPVFMCLMCQGSDLCLFAKCQCAPGPLLIIAAILFCKITIKPVTIKKNSIKISLKDIKCTCQMLLHLIIIVRPENAKQAKRMSELNTVVFSNFRIESATFRVAISDFFCYFMKRSCLLFYKALYVA